MRWQFGGTQSQFIIKHEHLCDMIEISTGKKVLKLEVAVYFLYYDLCWNKQTSNSNAFNMGQL